MKTYAIKDGVSVNCGRKDGCRCTTVALVVNDESGERVLMRAQDVDISMFDVLFRPAWVKLQDNNETNRIASMQRLLKQAERREGRAMLNNILAADALHATHDDVFTILHNIREQEQISENVMLSASVNAG